MTALLLTNFMRHHHLLTTIGWVAVALIDYCSICSRAAYSGSTTTILQSSLSAATLSSHEEQIERLSTHIRSRPISSRIVLQRSPAASHGVRPHGYKQDCFQIDISSFNQPLSIQSIPLSDVPSSWHGCIDFNRDGCVVVDAQAMLDMEGLVDYLLPYGLMPAVVPEFKGITVGRGIVSE